MGSVQVVKSFPLQKGGLRLTGGYATTPDLAGWVVTGQMIAVVKVSLDDWSPIANRTFIAHWVASGNQKSFWAGQRPASARPIFEVSSTGSGSTASDVGTFSPAPVDGDIYWLAYVWNSSTGVMEFHLHPDTSTNIPPPMFPFSGWKTNENKGAITPFVPFDSTAVLSIGADGVGLSPMTDGTIYVARIYDDGVLIADADFTPQASVLAIPGASTYTDSVGNVWTLNGAAAIVDLPTPILDGPNGLVLTGGYADTPDSIPNSIIGDIDIRAKISMVDWTPAVDSMIVTKWGAGSSSSFVFFIDANGTLGFGWSTDGTWQPANSKRSTVASGLANEAIKWIRVILDVNNGASGNDVKFYTSDDGVSWLQLGTTVTTAGVTSIFNGVEPVELGSHSNGTYTANGRIYIAQIYNGINGTLVANADFTSQASPLAIPGASTYTDSLGVVWTLHGAASIESISGPAEPSEGSADVTIGKPAYRLLHWGDTNQLFLGASGWVTWIDRGFGGSIMLCDGPASGSTQTFVGSSVLGDGSAATQTQRWFEGEGVGPPSVPAQIHNAGGEIYLLNHYQNTAISGFVPPWGDWFDDSTFAIIVQEFSDRAAFCQFLGLDGMAADCELYNSKTWIADGYTGDTHTGQQNWDEAYLRGQQVGAAVFQAMPNCKMITYAWPLLDSWGDSNFYHESPINCLDAFWRGYMNAGATYGGSGARIINFDAFFYKPTSQVVNVSLANACHAHHQGAIARMSQELPTAERNFWMDKFDIAPFSFSGTDGAQFYINVVGDNGHTPEPMFANQQSDYRLNAIGERRGEYNYLGSPNLYEYPTGQLAYVYSGTNPPGGHVPGLQAAANQTTVDSNAPTVTISSVVNNGNGTFTITGYAAHLGGMRCVKGWNVTTDPGLSSKKQSIMTWDLNGGSATTNFNPSRMAFSLVIPGTSGNYAQVTGVGARDQAHSEIVALP